MDAAAPECQRIPRCLRRLRAARRRHCSQPHPRSARDGTVAGKAKRALRIIDRQEIGTRIDVLHVRIVATTALHVAVDQRHRAGRILRGRRARAHDGHRSEAGCSGVMKLNGCVDCRFVPRSAACLPGFPSSATDHTASVSLRPRCRRDNSGTVCCWIRAAAMRLVLFTIVVLV